MSEEDERQRLEDYAVAAPASFQRRSARETPFWTPGFELDEDAGTIVSPATTSEAPDWTEIFASWGLSPEDWTVVPGSLRVNAWEGYAAGGETRVFRQFKAALVRAVRPLEDLDPVLERLVRFRPKRSRKTTSVRDAAFVVCAADFQIGGHEGGAAFVERFERCFERLVVAARAAARGRCGTLALLFLGDMVESVSGNYSSQLFTSGESGLDQRQQLRLCRAVEAKMIRELAPLFERTVCVAVPGNHGRGRRKVETRSTDNLDLVAFESVAEALTESGAAAEHAISFVAADPQDVALVDAAGTKILVAHGDQISSKAKIAQWWKSVSFQRWGDSDLASLLVTGHRHSLTIEEVGVDRFFFVAPTLGGASRWYAELGGGTSRPGILVFETKDGRWTNASVVPADEDESES